MSMFGDFYTGTDIDDDDKPNTAPQSGEDPKPEVKPGIPMTIPVVPPYTGPGGF